MVSIGIDIGIDIDTDIGATREYQKHRNNKENRIELNRILLQSIENYRIRKQMQHKLNTKVGIVASTLSYLSMRYIL